MNDIDRGRYQYIRNCYKDFDNVCNDIGQYIIGGHRELGMILVDGMPDELSSYLILKYPCIKLKSRGRIAREPNVNTSI